MIADRKTVGKWSGEIYFNSEPRPRVLSGNSYAYVLQDDFHIATLTVAETIYYAAWTRLPKNTTKEQMHERVELLLEMMGLSHVRDSFIGDALHKGISGGQQKRLSIAVEIVSLPELIFLDEPTSGLDSSISLEIMKVVRELSNQNRTTVSTIHQVFILYLFYLIFLAITGAVRIIQQTCLGIGRKANLLRICR